MANNEKWIDVQEASQRSGVPVMRIISLICLEKIDGVVIHKESAIIKESELEYLRR